MEERLLLNGVALHAADVSPWHVELAATIEADFADSGLAFGNGTTVTAGKTAYAVALDRLVEHAFADVLIEDFAEGGQREPLINILDPVRVRSECDLLGGTTDAMRVQPLVGFFLFGGDLDGAEAGCAAHDDLFAEFIASGLRE